MTTSLYQFYAQSTIMPNNNDNQNSTKKEFPNFNVTFRKFINKGAQISPAPNEIFLPFPPYRVSSDFRVIISLASIFGTFISDKDKNDVDESPLLKWLYLYKINYPHIPSIFDLMLTIKLDPETILENQNQTSFRLIIHKFCESLGRDAKLNIKEFSMAIPSNPVFKNFEADMIIFVPIITPIAAFPKQQDINDGHLPFPDNVVVEQVQNNEINGSAFNSNANTNSNDNSTTNINKDDDNNNNISNNNNSNNDNNSSNNKNSNNNDDSKTIFDFYAGIFESSASTSKYVLIKNGDKYYKYDPSNDNKDYLNDVSIVTAKSVNRDFCQAAFFLKRSISVSPFYQKI